jgi:hypothetical protein
MPTSLMDAIFGSGAHSMVQMSMKVITCANCAITFAVPEDFEKRRRNDHAWFYCPSGHTNYYPSESDSEKLRKQLAAEQHRREQIEADRTFWRERSEKNMRRVSAAKGRITRLRKRCVEGLCTCCNQQFPDLEKHMKEQHPDAATRED